MVSKFKGAMIEWRGPSPFYFVPIPEGPSKKIRAIAAQHTYGWGVIPVVGKIGRTNFSTALIPKDALYYLPIRNVVRFAEDLKVGSEVTVVLTLGKD
jgi:hypothetical protein